MAKSTAVASGTASPKPRRRTTRSSAADSKATSDVKEDKYDKLDKPVKAEKTKLETVGEMFDALAPFFFIIAGFISRMYKIGISNKVVWDEAHFGKFASYYIRRTFYFDVHPPLGKMLNGLAGYLANYNGSYEFPSGEVYPDYVKYVPMRVFNALFGALCVPLAYYTGKELRFSRWGSWMLGLLVLCESSYITISRFILLDSMLMFFTFTTVYALAKFKNVSNVPFSRKWWFWITALGVSLGCVCSVKWVGAFVTALVGLFTIHQLWDMFGDTDMPVRVYAKHWAARIYCLIVIPFLVYALTFKIHFAILNHSGPGDAQMPSLFQANLVGTGVGGGPSYVALGTKATIKNAGYGGGLLHSHVQTYPEGSGQQQVTCYHHKDGNNDWIFSLPYGESSDEGLKFIHGNDRISLVHAMTRRKLHSHNILAPVSTSDWEVSGYGNDTVGDNKDDWIVEIMDDGVNGYKRGSSEVVRSLSTFFRLRHAELGCYLRAANVNLPQWGFKQIEVTCQRNPSKSDKHTWWNVEDSWDERVDEWERSNLASKKGLPESPFWRDFFHLNVAMMTSNNALVPDPDKRDDLASKPWQWPTNNVGLRMCSWDDNTIKYYLLFSPVGVWASTSALGLFVIMTAIYALRWQRSYNDFNRESIDKVVFAGVYMWIGWLLHFIPFVIMARVTYVHHYIPALYFAFIVLCCIMEFVTERWLSRFRPVVYGIWYGAIIACFVVYAPISYGMHGSHSNYNYLNLLKTWTI
ncbi:glycosyltransferase family 39 protein, partial [Tortispora caseinolytica NRRL Y-17796]